MPEIRIPLYGMVLLSDLEWEIVNSPPFKRLRRIKQLAFSDYIYPGATHTRFEHTIGVMNLATQAFDRIRAKKRAREILESDEGARYDEDLWSLARKILRLAALTHDLGHLPFSHAAEKAVLPFKDGSPRQRYEHEDYSYGFIEYYIADILRGHRDNAALSITGEDIIDFLRGRVRNTRQAALSPWKGLIAGELDTDRMDYLRRDSHHLGVEYGQFDVERVLSVLTLLQEPESGATRLGVEEGGLLAVESLILARYYMYIQVYFHKVRRFLDLQYGTAFKAMLQNEGGTLPPPTSRENLDRYLEFDDWEIQSRLRGLAKAGHKEAKRVIERECFKVIFEISSVAQEPQKVEAEARLKTAGYDVIVDDGAEQKTQKFDKSNILIGGESSFEGTAPIQKISRVAMQIPDTIYLKRLYVSLEDRQSIRAQQLLLNLMPDYSRKEEEVESEEAPTEHKENVIMQT